MIDVIIPPDMWDVDSEGAISAWLYAAGDVVLAGAVIAEVMNEKVTAELVAPASGVLEILVVAEQLVRMGQVVARLS